MSTCKDASQHIEAGLASYLDEELRLYKPSIRRQSPKRNYLERKDQFYWLVRSAANHLFIVGQDSDFVVGVAVVREHGMSLHAFASHYEQAKHVDRTNAHICYALYAAKAQDKEMGEVWVLKVVRDFE